MAKKTKENNTETKRSASKAASSKKKNNTKNSNSKNKKSNNNKQSKAKRVENAKKRRIYDEIAAIILLAFGIFFAVAMHSSLAGAVGEAVSTGLKGLFGLGGFMLPYFLVFYSIMIFAGMNRPVGKKTVICMIIIFLSIDLVNAGRFVESFSLDLGIKNVFNSGVVLNNGGLVGMYMAYYVVKAIGMSGLYIMSAVLILISLLLTLNTPLSDAYDRHKIKKAERKIRRAEKQREKEEARALLREARDESQLDFFDVVNQENKNDEIKLDSHRLGSSSVIDDNSLYKNDNTFANRRKRKSILNLVKNEKDFGSKDENESKLDDEFLKQFESEIKIAEENQNNLDNIDYDFLERVNIHPESSVEEVKRRGYGLTDDGFASIDKKVIEANIAKLEEEEMFFKGASGASSMDGEGTEKKEYQLPPINLLNTPKKKRKSVNMQNTLAENAKLLEDTLKSFNVEAKVINVTMGSSVTRYEIQPAIGVKVASIVRLADDIALNLKARSIRIEAPIPGKAAIGIEVENADREMVCIGEIINSPEFKKHPSKLAFAVGRDISGQPVIADLAKMPHMLIAGATGSGKSVCINTIIASILYRAKPDEVKLVLVDPKMVELGNYNGIPHLLIPVVTDCAKAASALNWAVAEMTERYKKFAANGVREIKSYNEMMKREGQDEEVLPQIVIIIDELADLMMVASSQVEDAICRLAQLARAAGMHLIVATQRPSVDVVTGLIKANVPSRIAFMVSSQIDSRTIIDMAGAEKLVGNGDMLYKPQDLDKPLRVQGPYISDDEVKNLINYVKEQAEEVTYNEEIISHVEKGNVSTSGGEEEDVLMEEAIETVVRAGQASASMLQRKFRIGYNRAARIIDDLEARGVIGPQDGSRARSVLLTEEEWLLSREKVEE